MPPSPACPRSADPPPIPASRPGAILCRWLRGLSLLFLCCLPRPTAWADCRLLDGLAESGAFAVADAGGRVLDSCRLDQPMVPASVIKIATVQAALHLLGPDYRFVTEFYLDGQGNLTIKGFGDPTLMSEEVAAIVGHLRQQGLGQVRTLYVDASAFRLEGQVPGQEDSDNAYDAPVGPLSVNFNSVPLSKDKGGLIRSGEAQTPLLPIMAELGQQRPPGQHRVNICAGGYEAEGRMTEYAGQLFRALLEQGGIPVASLGGGRTGPGRDGRLFYRHQSRQTLSEISRSLLRYSSNFMANLVYLTCGAEAFGYPATWAKAREAVHRELARQLGAERAAAIVQVEGAGLSRANRITARTMLALLAAFRPHADLLGQEQGVSLKTGTLTGVYNYAGYLADGRPFVILLNQPGNQRAAVLARLSGSRIASAGGNASAGRGSRVGAARQKQ